MRSTRFITRLQKKGKKTGTKKPNWTVIVPSSLTSVAGTYPVPGAETPAIPGQVL
jgi:hypothetical protein